jgi:hypothetical protein
MAKDRKKDKAAKKAAGKEPKDLRKARAQWRALEDQIDNEFKMLVRDGYPMEELDTLRWDYRYAKLEDFKITQEQLEFFVAEADAKAAGLPPPLPPGVTARPDDKGAQGVPGGPTTGAEYQRKSQVDLDLVEKYLERRVGRETRTEMQSLYKEAFGEELQVPEKVDLVDISYHDMAGADAARKLSKAEILGIPDDAKPEEKKEEPVAAAPAVKKESRSLAVAMAWKKGVPPGPTRDEKWSALNPFKFWLIPKRLAGTSVGKYYAYFAVNLVIFVAQFALLLIPFLIRLFFWGIRYIWRRLLKQRVAPAMEKLKEKAAIPQPSAPEPKKETAPAKSS